MGGWNRAGFGVESEELADLRFTIYDLRFTIYDFGIVRVHLIACLFSNDFCNFAVWIYTHF